MVWSKAARRNGSKGYYQGHGGSALASGQVGDYRAAGHDVTEKPKLLCAEAYSLKGVPAAQHKNLSPNHETCDELVANCEVAMPQQTDMSPPPGRSGPSSLLAEHFGCQFSNYLDKSEPLEYTNIMKTPNWDAGRHDKSIKPG